MGLTFHEYKFLEEVSKKKNFGNVLTLGGARSSGGAARERLIAPSTWGHR